MSTMGAVEEELAATLSTVAERTRVDEAAADRIRRHLPALHVALAERAEASSSLLADLVTAAVVAANGRSLDLKVHGEHRAAHAPSSRSRYALGAACFADRYAGNLAGLRDEIPALNRARLRDLDVVLVPLTVYTNFRSLEGTYPFDLRFTCSRCESLRSVTCPRLPLV